MQPKMDRLKTLGFDNLGNVHWNLPTSALYEEAIRRREGFISHLGPFVVRTGQYTGRSPNDKYIVEEESSSAHVAWGPTNQPISIEQYERLRSRVLAYLQGRDLYVQQLYVGADLQHRITLQVISASAWHALFARTMFIIERNWEKLDHFVPDYTMIHVPYFRATPDLDGTRSEVFIMLNFQRKEILIGGTAYAGEMKKSVFTLMNYLLPQQGILSMHCSANYGETPMDGALFFGLSGTGKTTLSIESHRTLVGDDEHGWGDSGIFNLEGGCYAKVIRISRRDEPEIFETTRRFGTILENVSINPETRRTDLNDASLTENTRAAFPVTYLPNATRAGVASHPSAIFFLTADAFGVLPPIARLSTEQALYYFLLGYTAKVAGTERGIKEPQTTFSACFGAPFMVYSPEVYANLLGEKIRKHDVQVWLVNTGWTGGPYGEGHRIDLPHTRALIHAVLDGKLKDAVFTMDPNFGLHVPQQAPGVPPEILRPRDTWKDKKSYDKKANELAQKFKQAFKPFEARVTPEVKEAGRT